MTDDDRCPDCPPHRYHSRRCFAMDGMMQCQCPGSPSLMDQGRQIERDVDALVESDRQQLTFEGMREFFGR